MDTIVLNECAIFTSVRAFILYQYSTKICVTLKNSSVHVEVGLYTFIDEQHNI